MIGYIEGKVLFSDGREAILTIKSGIGYQVYFSKVLAEGSEAKIYISHIIRENSQELYGFKTLKEKKMFEMLTGVKGVGPKSAFNLVSSLGVDSLIQAIQLENKKTITKAPGIGPKAAAQIILDLSSKVLNIKMYSKSYDFISQTGDCVEGERVESLDSDPAINLNLIDEAVLACKELGFKEDEVLGIAQKIYQENKLTKSEQLVHLVLKEI